MYEPISSGHVAEFHLGYGSEGHVGVEKHALLYFGSLAYSFMLGLHKSIQNHLDLQEIQVQDEDKVTCKS
jgi:hypothetical protein